MERKTSIIILTYNNLEYTKKCLESILKYTKKDTKEGTYEIIIVDNNSTDGTKEWLENYEDKYKIIFNEENLGFPKGVNQALKFAEGNNDILLLNNDTIVTSNWLDNLKICLNSDSLIGAVGAVSNNDENRQGVDFTYNSLEEMQELALKNNISNKDKWEEKNFLIGYCLLIKREVMDELGFLDEAYTPGYIEDNDLSLRILSLGYKLILCHDSFIHHYLGTSFRKNLNEFYPILNKNREYFKNKWGFETFLFDEVKSASIPLLTNPHKILEINSGIGTTILNLKYNYKNIEIEGIESNPNKRFFAKMFGSIYQSLDEVNNTYDCVLIGDTLKSVNDPLEFLKKISDYLSPDGYLIGEIPNGNNIKNIYKLLNEKCFNLNSKEQNLFSQEDIKNVLEQSGYHNITFYSWYEVLSSEEEKLLTVLNNYNANLKFTYYTFRAQK